MLALSIAVSALADPTNAGQPAATPNAAESFLALLNIGNGNESNVLANTQELMLNDSNYNPPAPTTTVDASVNVPTTIFAANSQNQHIADNNAAPVQQTPASSVPSANASDANAPSTPTPPVAQQSQPQNASGNASSNSSDEQSQNVAKTPAASTPSSSANAPSSQTAAQTGGATANQPAKQARNPLQDQLADISQILLGLIQNVSGGAAQPATAGTASTASSAPLTASGDGLAAPATGAQENASGQTAEPALNAQELALLKNAESFVQQLQQALTGQGQDGTGSTSLSDIEKLTNSLLADVTKLSQLTAALRTGSTGTSAAATASVSDSLLSAAQPSSDANALLKTSLTQVTNQLQNLKTATDAVTAQSQVTSQPQSLTVKDVSATPSTSSAAFTASAAAGTPVVQDSAIKPLIAAPQFTAVAPVVAGVSSDSGNSSTGDQNQEQNQAPQTVAATASSAPTANTGAAANSTFAKLVNQTSPADVLNQIQFQVKTALGDGSSKINIHLSPAELGDVNVKLTIGADGKTSGIMITADNKNTLELLQRDTQGLTRALNDAGLSTDSGSLNFSLGGGQQNQGQANQQAAFTYKQAQPEEEDESAIVTNTITRSYSVSVTDGLDITI